MKPVAEPGKRLAVPAAAPLRAATPPRIPGGRGRGARPLSATPPAALAVPVHGRSRRRSSPEDRVPRLTEVVHFYLYDVGRKVDLKKVASFIPAHDDLGIAMRRDTPASLTLPKPLILQLGESECAESGGFECFSAQAKIYEDGAITVLVRVKARLGFVELHRLAERRVISGDRELTISEYAEESFRRLFGNISTAISDPYEVGQMDTESYTAYCILDCPEDPAEFLARNRDYAAALLIGEESGSQLHPSQIEATLGKPFSYHRGDLAVFDLDRCLIIDPAGDYEDLLLIAEHANYQLLELRVLDELLDTWLDEAEDDVRLIYGHGGRRGTRRRGAAARAKFANIQALRFESLFILENIENSSKIIGDYYLGQIYDQLCSIFNTEGWKWSVERRLDALQDVYEMVKNDSGERRMVALEITFIVVCIVFPIVQILQVYIK